MVSWLDTAIRTEIQGLSQTHSLGDVAIGFEFATPLTIQRIRGNFAVHINFDAASSSGIVGLGLIIASADAFTAGSASVPSPLDDLDSSWIWHELVVFGPTVGAEVATSLDQYRSGMIDSKAQRKVHPNDVLAFVWDGLITAGSPTFEGIAAVRTLVMQS